MTQTTFEVPRSGFIHEYREYIYVGLRPFEFTTELIFRILDNHLSPGVAGVEGHQPKRMTGAP